MKQVVAGIIVREGQILICQRRRDQDLPLKWEFPGGKVEPQEDREAALRRELEEELGIQARIGRRAATVQHSYRGSGVEIHFYFIEEFAGEVRNYIFNEIQWVPPINLPSYDFLEADIALVKKISSGELRLAI